MGNLRPTLNPVAKRRALNPGLVHGVLHILKLCFTDCFEILVICSFIHSFHKHFLRPVLWQKPGIPTYVKCGFSLVGS